MIFYKLANSTKYSNLNYAFRFYWSYHLFVGQNYCSLYIYVLFVTEQEKFGELQDDLEVSKGHKKHYDQKLKEQEKKITDLKSEIEKFQLEIEVCITCRMELLLWLNIAAFSLTHSSLATR